MTTLGLGPATKRLNCCAYNSSYELQNFMSLLQEKLADSTLPDLLISAATIQICFMTSQLEREGPLYYDTCIKDALGRSLLGEAL